MDGLPADPLAWLRTQVRKDGVGLGGLPWEQQRLARADRARRQAAWRAQGGQA